MSRASEVSAGVAREKRAVALESMQRADPRHQRPLRAQSRRWPPRIHRPIAAARLRATMPLSYLHDTMVVTRYGEVSRRDLHTLGTAGTACEASASSPSVRRRETERARCSLRVCPAVCRPIRTALAHTNAALMGRCRENIPHLAAGDDQRPPSVLFQDGSEHTAEHDRRHAEIE